jgi:hypothetical protein
MAITKIGTPELFDFSATNTALQLPTGDTASRPSAPSAGEWRFNTTEKYVEYWDGSAWKQIDTEELPNPDDFPSQNFNVNTYFGTDASHKIDAKFNEAANFNGSTSNIQVANSGNVFEAVGGFSASVWVNRNTTANQTILNKEGAVSGSYGWSLRYTSGAGYSYDLYDASNNLVTVSTGANSTTGNWEHIVISFNNSDNKLRIYFDGGSAVVSSALGTSPSSNTENFFIGARTGGSIVTDGKLDQVRIYSAAITDAQANDLYTDETTTTASTLNFPVGAGCVAAYQLDGDASDVGGTYGGVTTDIGYTGLRFQPDMVWVKRRVSGSESHALYDSIRGINKQLSPDNSLAEATNTAPYEGFTSFDTNGFTVDNNGATNRAPNSYVAWAFKGGGAPTTDNVAAAGAAPTSGSFKIDGSNASSAAGTIAATRLSANTAAGFSIVKYTGGTGTIPHGLGITPSMLIQKSIGSSAWYVYLAPGVVDATSTYYYLELNTAVTAGTTGSTPPTSTTFNPVSTTGTFISYLYANIAGYQKIGTYIGNSSTSNIISTEITSGDGGFEPAFVIIKAVNSGDNWIMLDNKRLNGSFPYTNVLYPNLTNSELANVGGNGEYSINFLTNGFQLTEITAGYNQSGEKYVYLAIAADKDSSVPTQANSFSPTIYTGNGASSRTITTSIDNDFVWIKKRGPSTGNHLLQNTVQGAGTSSALSSNSTTAAGNFDQYGYISAFTTNGVTIQAGSSGSYPNDNANENNSTYVAWAWKAGGLPTINSDGNITSIVSGNQAAGFSIVKFAGASGANTVGHGLSAAPELVIMKSTDVGGYWGVYLKDVGANKYLSLNTNDSAITSTTAWNNTHPTSTVLSWQGGIIAAGAGYNNIAYCFTSITGYQKVGSYTGNGSTTGPIETTGFEPRYLLIKSADNSSTNWIILDKARTPNNPLENDLKANLSSVEQTGTGNNYPQATTSATGFQVNTTDGAVNGSGTYIYLAIA